MEFTGRLIGRCHYQQESSVVFLKFAEINLACGAGDSIKPGVERSGTPG